MIELLSTREIELMRLAGLKAGLTLSRVGMLVKPGTSTFEIDEFVRHDCAAQECTPAPLGYRGHDSKLPPFPGACCTSINEVVCHGIPNERKLKDGDIVNVDVTHIFMGYHGDTSKTFEVGNVSSEARFLVESCRRALELGIEQVRPNARFGDIGAVIQEFAQSCGLSVVTAFVGHGIGRMFHGAPNVAHSAIRGTGPRMKPGMCFTIEPMLNLGRPEVKILDDRWTAVTADGSLSAQFEHTVLVTDDGCDVLTRVTPLVQSVPK